MPAAEETPVEEEPEEPEILPVDATLLVGDSWRGTFSGERDTFLLRLTVKGQQAVHLATDGLPVSVNLSNEATGSSRVFACKYDNEMNAWNLISADFELTDGSYLMTVTPIQAGSTGAVTLSVFPQALVKEDPAEVGKPAEEKTPAGDETPAEEEAPAEDESPAGDEPTVENATPAEAGIPAADITPAEDKTPAEDEKPSEDETSAEDEQPAEKTEPVSDEASAAVTVVPEQSAEDEQPAEETKSEPSDEDTHIEGKTDVETGLDGETGEDGEPGAVEDGNAKAPAGEPEAAALIARVEGDDLVIEADGGILPANAQAAYQNYGEPDADSWIREWFGDNGQAEIHPQPLRAKMTKAAPVMLSPMNGSKAGYSMFSVSLIGAESAGDGVYSVTVRTRIDLRGGLDEDAVIDSVSYALYAINGDELASLPVSVTREGDTVTALTFRTSSWGLYLLRYVVDYTIVPEDVPQGDFCYTFIGAGSAVTLGQILDSNGITLTRNYPYVSASDPALVSLEEISGGKIQDNNVRDYVVTALAAFDAVTLILRNSKNEIRIALTCPPAVEPGTVIENAAGSFMADTAVPAGTVLVSAPAGEDAHVTAAAKTILGDEAQVAFYDWSLAAPDGSKVQTGAKVTVKTDIELPEDMDVQNLLIFHVYENGTVSAPINADYEVRNGRIVSVSFHADGFSIYGVAYTVDFHFHGIDYSIEGNSQILLSELVGILGLAREDGTAFTMAEVASVSFSHDRLLTVQEVSGLITYNGHEDVDVGNQDYLLTSKMPFTSDERLTIVLTDGEVVSIGVTDAVQESSNLQDFLTGVTVSGAQIQGDHYVVQEGQKYEVTMIFKETGDFQFDNESLLTYQMPEGITLPEESESEIKIAIVSNGRTYEIPATVHGYPDGRVTVKFDDSDPNYSRLAAATNVGLRIKLEALFTEDVHKEVWSASIDKDIIIDTDDHSDVFVEKIGSFNEADGKFYYTIKVKAQGNPQNVNVKDVISGNALIFNDDVQVSGNSGYTVNSAQNGFDYTFAKMRDGEQITITYTASLNPRQVSTGTVTADQTKNTVTVKKEDGEPHHAEFSQGLTLKKPVKGNGADTGTTAENGDKIYSWTSEYNSLALISAAGDIITDTIDAASQEYMKNYGNVTVEVYNHDGALVDTRSFEPQSESSWSYTVPSGDTEPYRYVFKYQTIVNQAQVDGQGTSVTIRNKISSGDQSGSGVIDVSPKEMTTISKSVVSSNTQKVTWKSVIHVPESGLAQAVVRDMLPVWWDGSKNNIDLYEDGSLSITGLAQGEAYTVDTSDPLYVDITFYKNEAKTQPGLQAVSGGHDITVQLTTYVNDEWLQYGYEHPGGYESSHTNQIRINEGDYVSAYVTFAKPDIKKTGIESGGLYTYTIVVSDVKQEPLVIQDVFDTNILALYTENPYIWNQLKVFGGNQYDQSEGGYPVNYSDTPEGIVLTANTLPKQENGEFYSYYKITYVMKLRDGVNLMELAAQQPDNKYELTNTAVFGEHESSYTFTTEYDILNKELLKEATDSDRHVKYRITYNPEKVEKNDGAPVTMTDTLSPNLSLNYPSVTITTDPADAEVIYSASGSSNGETVVTYIIPDSTKAVIEYEAMVVGNGPITYENTVDVRGEKSIITRTVDIRIEGEGEGATADLNVLKVDGYDANKRLAGVKFKLYGAQGEDLSLNHSGVTEMILETDPDGIIHIDGAEIQIIIDHKYYLEEVEPPDGYGRISFPYQFTLVDDADEVDYPHYIYFYTDSLQIKNWPLEGLVVGKTIVSDNENDLKQRFTFNVSILDGEGNVDTAVNQKYGDMEFINGVATFELTNKEQLMAWDMPEGTKFKVEELNPFGYTVLINGETTENGPVYTGVSSIPYTQVEFTNNLNTVEVTVNKVWSFAAANSAVAEANRITLDDGAKWPKDTTVKVKLQKKVGTSGTVTDVEGTDATAILSSEKPSHTFSGLVAYEGTNEITYSVKEVEISGTYANNFTLGAAEKQEDGSYKITNNEKVADLTITKSFGDSDLTEAQKAGITFKVEGTGLKKDGATVTELTKTYAEFTNGQWVLTQADGIMDGATYTVSEVSTSVDIAGYQRTTTIKVNNGEAAEKLRDSIKIADGTGTVAFVNTYALGKLTINKSFAGNAANDLTAAQKGSLKFTVAGKAGTATAGYSEEFTYGVNNAEKHATWSGDTLTITELKLGEYTVTESGDTFNDADGNAYNHSVKYKVGTTETTANGTVEATVAGGAIDVTNTYEKAKLEITKTVSGKTLTDVEKAAITFTVSGEGVNAQKKLSEMGAAMTWTLTQADGILPGKTYTVTESGAAVEKYTKVTKIKANDGEEKTTETISVTVDGTTGIGKVTVTNTYTRDEGSLKIEKTATVNGSETNTDLVDGTYSFTVQSAADADPETTKTVTITILNGKVSSVGGDGEKDGEYAKVSGLPTGEYTVTEDTSKLAEKGITLLKSENTKVTVVKDGEGVEIPTATFQNNMAIESTPLKAQKTLSGRDFREGDKWTFTVTANPTTAPLPTKTTETIEPTSGESIEVDFGTIEYTQKDAGKTYTYTITETGTVNGVTNDGAKTVTVKITDNGDGTLKVENSSETTPVEFVNTYYADGSATLKGTKKIVGREFQEGDEWTFVVSAQPADAPMPDKVDKNSQGITVKPVKGDSVELDFGEIKFTLDDLKGNSSANFEYRIVEEGRIKYVKNDVEKIVHVMLKDLGDGKLEATVQESAAELVFTNTYGKGDLAVEKTVVNGLDPDKEFAFTVTLSDKEISGTYGEMTFEKGVASFTLKDGEKKTATGLPVLITYKVEEEAYDGYFTQSANAESVIDKDNCKTATFTNTYAADGEVVLSAKKVLNGRELKADEFTFELKAEDGTLLQSKKNAADGTVTFDTIKYTQESMLDEDGVTILTEKNVYYKIHEVVPEDAVNEAGVTYAEAQDKNDIFTKDCIRYDGRIVEIKVTLKDDQAGKIETAAEPNGESITFANEYITQGEITLGGTKKLVNRAMGENEFTFELYELQTNAEGGEEFVKIDEATNAADGSYSFTVIEYTDEDLDTDANGNYIETTKTYKVAEQADPESALIFDKTEYVITVTLTDDGNGKIETSADPAENACDFTNILVKVSKVDVADQKELEGATIQIIDKETGEVVFEFTSGEEATEIDNLETGKTYILHETVAPDGYKVTSDTEFTVDADGTITGSCTMTADEEGNIVLLVEDDKTCVRVSKVDAADGHELEGAHIQILDKDGNVVDEWDSAKDSAHEITGLLTGEDNVYTLRETVAPYGYDITTDTTFWLDAEGKVTSTGNTTEDEEGNIILLVEDDMKKIPAAVKKVWDDDENRDGVRPVSLTVDLLANGEVYRTVTLTAANGWTLLLKDLPCVDAEQKDIEYTWSERDPGNGYTLTGTSVEGILTILTNHYDTEKTSVSVQKIWDDVDDISGKRPDSIVVQLYGDGEAVGDAVTLSESNGWSYTWTELNKNCNPNGLTGESRVIEYTVCELEVPEYYVETVTGNATTGFVITNKMDHGSLAIEKTFDLGEDEEDDDDEETTEITVTKTWNDNGNKEGNRPGSVTVHLMANGSEVASASLSEGSGWAYTFTDLPKKDDSGEKISYTISEDSVPMYTSRISGYNVINTYETELTSASVSKIWIGDDHPSSITVTLSNGQSVVLSDANGWSATINNLPVTVNGQTVTYTWTEAQVPGYRQVSVMTNGNSTVFTNEKIETPKIPEEQQEVVRRPQTPGVTLQVFEEYDTALGVNIIINHVGDCFD